MVEPMSIWIRILRYVTRNLQPKFESNYLHCTLYLTLLSMEEDPPYTGKYLVSCSLTYIHSIEIFQRSIMAG